MPSRVYCCLCDNYLLPKEVPKATYVQMHIVCKQCLRFAWRDFTKYEDCAMKTDQWVDKHVWHKEKAKFWAELTTRVCEGCDCPECTS